MIKPCTNTEECFNTVRWVLVGGKLLGLQEVMLFILAYGRLTWIPLYCTTVFAQVQLMRSDLFLANQPKEKASTHQSSILHLIIVEFY